MKKLFVSEEIFLLSLIKSFLFFFFIFLVVITLMYLINLKYIISRYIYVCLFMFNIILFTLMSITSVIFLLTGVFQHSSYVYLGELRFTWPIYFSWFFISTKGVSIVFSLTTTSVSFILLFSILYLIILYLILFDYKKFYFLFYVLFNYIIFLTYLLLIINNFILFFISYELIVFLTLIIIFLSSNSRGSSEAVILYLIWAIIGSIFIGSALLYFMYVTRCTGFTHLFRKYNLTREESQVIYWFLFLGFGTKLSLWPFWYWLPKAHVEVSTGISIFLSCVLIKIAIFALIQFKLLINIEISYNLIFFLTILGIVEVTIRLVDVVDLKAMIAYSSVLHTNLFLILMHLSNFKFFAHLHLYIWSHSLISTLLFLISSFLENKYKTRNYLLMSGLWSTDTFLSTLLLLTLIIYIGFPLTFFFWAEFYLWLYFSTSFPFFTVFCLFFTNLFFLIIFFKNWWGIFFGTTTSKKIFFLYKKEKLFWTTVLLIIQWSSVLGITFFINFFQTIIY